MRQIHIDAIGHRLTELLGESDPISEDIEIVDSNGSVIGVVISPRAYEFFLKKVEEEEDRIDNKTADDFHKSKG